MALCLLSPASAPVVRKITSPGKGVSEESLRAAIVELAPDVAYVELVGLMPGQGMSSGSTFMVAWGLIRGCLLGLGVRYELVSPLRWKNSLLAGVYMGPPFPKEKCPAGLKGPARKAWNKEALRRKKAVQAERKKVQKQAAVDLVGRRLPEVELVRPRCRVADHNLAEAVCLALYGQEVERAR